MFTDLLFSARPARALLGIFIAVAAFGSFAAPSGLAIAAGVPAGVADPQVAAAHAAQTWAQLANLSVTHATVTQPTSPSKASTGAPAANATLHSSATAILADTRWSAEPCQSGTYVSGGISQWKVPPGCYGGVYWINTRNFVARSGFGWCNWWPEVLHPDFPNVIYGARHSTPVPGAVVVFAPGEQGAGSGGHYGEVVAVLGHGWILISEMNNSWRGGFARVTYRYVYQSASVSYIY